MAEAHLNGSLNLRSAEEAFRTVSEIAGETIKRLPDGETDERRGWIEAIGPIFRRLRDEAGVIAPGMRFQVSLPTVTAGVEPFVVRADQGTVEPAYERRLRRETDEILATVPHEDLALQWFSMPVPNARDDDAYFEPLADLKLDAEATLYLGLVHHQDGVDGTQRRVDVARRHYSQFGVSTECGMGRKPRELVATLLTIQREVRVD